MFISLSNAWLTQSSPNPNLLQTRARLYDDAECSLNFMLGSIPSADPMVEWFFVLFLMFHSPVTQREVRFDASNKEIGTKGLA